MRKRSNWTYTALSYNAYSFHVAFVRLARMFVSACAVAFMTIGLALLLAVVFVAAHPAKALANYENPTVTTIAQMQTDNSLRVTSQRAYVFDEQYAIVTIPLSRASNESTLAMESVRLIQISEDGTVIRNWWNLDEVRFQPAWRDLFSETEGLAEKVRRAESTMRERTQKGDGAHDFFTLPKGDAFSFDSRNDLVYVFLTPTSLNTVIEYDYTIDQAAVVYEDVAELYWDYVSSDIAASSENVNVQIQLPVPEGTEVVVGDTVSAWGHGPDGTVEVKPDGTVDYRVKTVPEGQYAQAHVVFPSSWLSNLSVLEKLKKSGLRRDQARVEEATWTDSYTAGVVNSLTLDIAQVVLCVLLLLAAVGVYLWRGREDDDVSTVDGVTDERLAEMLAELEPAVVARLLRSNHWSGEDIGITLLSLAKKGVISIDGSGEETRFKVTPAAKSHPMTNLDRLTMELTFDVMAEGYQSVSLREMCQACRREPATIKRLMEIWQRQLDEEVLASNLFDQKSRRWALRLGIVAGVLAFIGIIEWVTSGHAIPSIALVLTGVVMGVIAYNTPRRTALGCTVAHVMADRVDADEDVHKDNYLRVGENIQKSANPLDNVPEWVPVLAHALEEAVVEVSDGSDRYDRMRGVQK